METKAETTQGYGPPATYPLPWEARRRDYENSGGGYWLGSSASIHTFFCPDGAPQNKERVDYIVRAANAYPALVEACQAALREIETATALLYRSDIDPDLWPDSSAHQLRAALEAAGVTVR